MVDAAKIQQKADRRNYFYVFCPFDGFRSLIKERGVMLSKCQTVYTTCRNRVFPYKKSFARKYAIHVLLGMRKLLKYRLNQ